MSGAGGSAASTGSTGSTAKGGRKPADIWAHFLTGNRIGTGNRFHYSCNGVDQNGNRCLFVSDGRVDKAIEHVIKCKFQPEGVRAYWAAKSAEKATSGAAAPDPVSRTIALGRLKVGGSKQSTLDGCFDTECKGTLAPELTNMFHRKQLRAFVMCNFPFRAADNQHFLDWMTSVRPNHMPASEFPVRRRITSLLAEVSCRAQHAQAS